MVTYYSFRFALVCVLLLSWYNSLSIVSFAYTQDREELKKGVVQIKARMPSGNIETSAGIVVGVDSQDVYILTALHSLFGEDEDFGLETKRFDVQFYQHNQPILGRLYGEFDEELDLAVIVVSVRDLTSIGVRSTFKTGNLAKVNELDEIVTIGHPFDNPWQLSSGQIIKVETNLIRFSGDAVYPGNSGGALLNNKKHLIGMVTSRTAENGFGVRIDIAKDKLKQWRVQYQLDDAPASKTKWIIAGGAGAALLVVGAIVHFSNGSEEFPLPPGRPGEN